MNNKKVTRSGKSPPMSRNCTLLVKTVFGGCRLFFEVVSSRAPRQEIGSENVLKRRWAQQTERTGRIQWHQSLRRHFLRTFRLELTTSTFEHSPPKTVFIVYTEFSYDDRDIWADFWLRVTFLLFVLFQNGQKYDNSMNFLLRLVLTDLCYNGFEFWC